MAHYREDISLPVRAVLVSFDSAARTLTMIGDERALRRAYDRARMLLESLPHSSARHSERLDAGDQLLRSYRHHVERCDIDVYVATGISEEQRS